jgi:hypothetical protein
MRNIETEPPEGVEVVGVTVVVVVNETVLDVF